MPGDLAEDRVVGLPGIGDRDPAILDGDCGLALDEVPADLRRIALLEPAQFVGQLMVMWLSRQREYFADEFSARLTGNPVSLMSALAKISYGPAAAKSTASSSMVKALYFAEPSGGKMNVAEVVGAINSGNDATLAAAIENEKKHGGFEFLMTHPITAKRLDALLKVKKEIGA